MDNEARVALGNPGGSGLGQAVAIGRSRHGIRIAPTAPRLLLTPPMRGCGADAQQSLAASMPCPEWLGKPDGFAWLTAHAVTDAHLDVDHLPRPRIAHGAAMNP